MIENRQHTMARAIRGALIALATALCAVASNAAATGQAPPGHATAAAAKKAAAEPVKRIDINSAGRAELKTLPGIGDEQAAKIIAARPYLTKADLVTKNVLPTGIYIALKDRIIAGQPAKPVARK